MEVEVEETDTFRDFLAVGVLIASCDSFDLALLLAVLGVFFLSLEIGGLDDESNFNSPSSVFGVPIDSGFLQEEEGGILLKVLLFGVSLLLRKVW